MRKPPTKAPGGVVINPDDQMLIEFTAKVLKKSGAKKLTMEALETTMSAQPMLPSGGTGKNLIKFNLLSPPKKEDDNAD